MLRGGCPSTAVSRRYIQNMVHRNVLVGCIAMFSGAAAFQAPVGLRLGRSSPTLARSSAGLRMQVDICLTTLRFHFYCILC